MKKRRALLIIPLILLLIIAIPTAFLIREFRHEQASRDLIAAIKAGDTKRVLEALRAGANPNCRDHSFDPPLSFGAHMKHVFDKLLHPHLRIPEQHPEIVKALLDAGANPNLKVGSEWSPLKQAAIHGYDDSVRLLIEHGANIDTQVSLFDNVLYRAAIQNHASTIRILIDSGANVNDRIKNGSSILDCIQHPSNHHHPEIIAMLKKAGAKTSAELNAQAASAQKK